VQLEPGTRIDEQGKAQGMTLSKAKTGKGFNHGIDALGTLGVETILCHAAKEGLFQRFNALPSTL
jgi:hypothetical protein